MGGQMRTVSGVLDIVHGECVAEALTTLAVHDPAATREQGAAKGDLFVLVDSDRYAHGSSDRSPPRVLAEIIRDTYFRSPAGVIASLRRALLDVGRPPPGMSSDATSGLLAVVVRGLDVFIASTGATVVYVVCNDRAVRFPDRQRPPTHTDHPLEPAFFHTIVAPGATLVLGDSRFAAAVAPEDIVPAVSDCDVDEALANLGDLLAGQDGTLMVVRVEGDAGGDSRRPRGAASLFGRDSTPSPKTDRDTGAPRDGLPLRASAATVISALRRSELVRLLGYVARNVMRGALVFFVLVWRALRTLMSNVLPERRPSAAERPASVQPPTPQPAGGRVRAAGRPPAVTGAAAPTDDAGEAEEVGTAGTARLQPALRLVAIAIPLIVAALAGVMYWRHGVAQENTFQTLMEQAQTLYQQALNADEPTALRLLERAEQTLAEAATIRPGDTGQSELRLLVIRQLDRIGRVERLYLLGRLRTYDNPMTRLRRVVVDGLDVYVLDTGTDMVYYHRLDDVADSLRPDEGDPVVVRRAQQVAGNVVGELVDITWSAATPDRRSGALLIVGADDLLAYTAGGKPDDLVIGGRDRWSQPIAAVGYGGNLYLLDPQAGQIFRYRPGAGGYPGAPEDYLSPDSPSGILAGAVDMAIDGYIYVLYADGQIRRFEGGVPTPFSLQGLDRPLLNPTAIFAAPDAQVRYLYIVDAGNRRILQFEKDGRFVRQLKPGDDGAVDFAALRAIFVDEVAGKMYLVDGVSLLIAAVPRLE